MSQFDPSEFKRQEEQAYSQVAQSYEQYTDCRVSVYGQVRIGAQEKASDSPEVYAWFEDFMESNRRPAKTRVPAGLSHIRPHDLKRGLEEDAGRPACLSRIGKRLTKRHVRKNPACHW